MNNKKIILRQSSRSILEELQRAVPTKTTAHVVEIRGHHIISSAVHFLDILTENYTEEEAEQITRRFLSAIRGSDPQRFIRSVRKIREAREESRNEE